MNKLKEQYDVIYIEDLERYIRYRERKAQIKVLKEIKPYGNGKRIQSMIDKLNKKPSNNRKKNTTRQPHEFNITVSDEPTRSEFSNIEQYMVVED